MLIEAIQARAILNYLLLLPAIFGYFWISQPIFCFLRLSRAISGYREQSRDIMGNWAISGYVLLSFIICSCLGLFGLYLAFTEYFRLSHAILSYFWLYQVSSIRGQVKEGESNVLLFETFWFLIFHSFIEPFLNLYSVASPSLLLKIPDYDIRHNFTCNDKKIWLRFEIPFSLHNTQFV